MSKLQAIFINISSCFSLINFDKLCIRFLKLTMGLVFYFMFSVLHLGFYILSQFLKLISSGAIYQLFPTLPCKQFKLESSLTKKLKFKHLVGLFEMF